MENPDRRVRKAAFEGGNAAWERVEDVTAAALNAISGTRLTLNEVPGGPAFSGGSPVPVLHYAEDAGCDVRSDIFRNRGWAPDPAFQGEGDGRGKGGLVSTSEPRFRFPMSRRWIGRKVLAWFRVRSPGRIRPWGRFTQDMYDRRWIDYEPRAGKRPGGFCTGSAMISESRIFMTYNRTMGDTLTLAHEAGHAFHSHVMRDLRPFARGYPMTLAESASTFAEMILADGVLSDPDVDDHQKAVVLDSEVGHAGAYLMDIPVRFEFEKALYEERGGGELSVSQLKSLMTEKQREVFGDVLQEGGEDPWFWASKLHFYITGVTFYNFPYTFGYLLSRGLFAMFKEEGPDFLPRYERFLRLTGRDSAENVAIRSIGSDLEQPDFWVQAIRSLEEPLAQLEALLPRVLPAAGEG